MHLAELNVGRLVAPAEDPRVAEFMEALARVNGLGKRMPGFVWMMEDAEGAGTGNTGTKIGGDPRFVSNLTVWDSLSNLETFVWKTVHRQFYDRRAAWFEVLGEMHFVMWQVAEGHRPTLEEALERLALRQRAGDSAEAFGWDWAREHLR
jgi:heme-degrading monooxygenase HmoA